MRTISLAEWGEQTKGAHVLARNDDGGMTLRCGDGTYLKLFRRPALLSSARVRPLSSRFAAAAEELERRGISTVRALERLRIAETRQHAIRYQGVDGESLSERLAKAPEPEARAVLIERFADFAAHLHDRGILFHGLRFDNVVMQGARFGLIDVGATTFRSRSLSASNRVRNFRKFLRYDDDRRAIEQYGLARFFTRYVESSRLPPSESRRLLDAVSRAAAGPARRQTWTRVMLAAPGAPTDLVEALWRDAPALMAKGVKIKEGDRTTIVSITSRDGSLFMLKRANLRGWLHTALHFLVRSRGMWGWRNAERVTGGGLRSPRPVALLEERCGPLRFRSYLLTHAVEGETLLDWTKGRRPTDLDVIQIAEEFGSIWHALGRLRLWHRDMKATNFVVDREGRIWLVDLDAMRTWPRGILFGRARRRDRERFLRNWKDRPEVREVFRARIDRAAAPAG